MGDSLVQEQRVNGLSCLIEKDKETGVFIGHCLNYNIMECGGSVDEAYENLKLVLKHHIEFCHSRYPAGLTRQAPKEDWDKFYIALQENRESLVVDRIEIEPLPPLPEHEIPIWIQGVTSGGELPVI